MARRLPSRSQTSLVWGGQLRGVTVRGWLEERGRAVQGMLLPITARLQRCRMCPALACPPAVLLACARRVGPSRWPQLSYCPVTAMLFFARITVFLEWLKRIRP